MGGLAGTTGKPTGVLDGAYTHRRRAAQADSYVSGSGVSFRDEAFTLARAVVPPGYINHALSRIGAGPAIFEAPIRVNAIAVKTLFCLLDGERRRLPSDQGNS